MHGPLAPAVAAERDRHQAAQSVTGLGPVMGRLHRHAQVRQQPLGAGLRIHGCEHAADGFRIVNQPLDGSALARYERQRGELILERPHLLLETGLLFAGVGGHHPQLVGVFLPGPLEESDHRFHLATGMGLAGAQPPADPLLPHEVDEVQLGRGAEAVARNVDVLGRAGEDAP